MTTVDRAVIESIRSSDLFDEEFYLEKYRDVAALRMDPVEHYVWVGVELGRDPSAEFCTNSYLEANPDVACSKVNPLFHFVRWGRKEGRSTGHKRGTGKRWRADPRISYIESGPFAIKRHYPQFDFDREARFLEQTDLLYKSQPKRFDEIAVTVIMPTFNRADKIGAAIKSVFDQQHRNWHLIIVDDGSEDNTAEVVEPFLADKRIEYIVVDHVGVSGARNAGLLKSTGKYIAYLDSDNCWNSNFLYNMIVLMEIAGLDSAYSGIHSSDDHGETVCYRGDAFVWQACLKSNYVDLNPFMHKRDLIFRGDQPELFDTNLKRFVDWDLILRLTKNAEVAYAPFVGVEYYDGRSGGRITLTQYQNAEADERIAAIRAKHRTAAGDVTTIDTGAGLRLALPQGTGEQAEDIHYALRFYPDYTVNNAYQNLLYSPIEEFDVAPGSIDDCLGLIFRPQAGNLKVVFHLHWTDPVIAPASDATEAFEMAESFLAKLRLFKSLGGRILWTVHNVSSHEPKHFEQEIALYQALADLADWVHVHHKSVPDATKEFYQIPEEKVLVAEHGNYIDLLPVQTTQVQCRREFGIPASATVFLFLGQIRGYKGIDELINAFTDLVKEHKNVWMVIAGKVLGVDKDEIARKLRACGNTVFRPGYVPEEEMQLYLGCADAMVLPYRKVLTSGSVFLALSYSLPVICPPSGLLSHLVTDGKEGLFFDPEDSNGLAHALQRFLEVDPELRQKMRQQALETAKAYQWPESALTLQRHIEGLDFGAVEQPEIAGNRRHWFVRGQRKALNGKRCIAIILHYQNIDDTLNCIENVRMQREDVGLVVISNAEKLDDLRALAKQYPDLLLVQSEDNIGYAAANNFGLWICRESQAEFFWIINPDIVVPPGFLDALMQRSEDWPEHDFFGTTIVGSADPDKVLFCGGEVRLDQGASPCHSHMGERTHQLPPTPFECDYLTGANIFGRVAALEKVGYLPESYFLYFEETDWFLEMQLRKGLQKPLVFPDLQVENHKRSEHGLIPSRYYMYYFIRNSLLFGQKFAPDQLAQSEAEARKFAAAWLGKIAAAAPDKVVEFEILIDRAIADGREQKSGRIALASF